MILTENLVSQARALVKEFQHPRAEALLKDALKDGEKNPNLSCELAIIYCFTQREFDAVEILQDTIGAERHDELVKILNEYFYCRGLLAKQHNVADEKAKELAKKVKKFAPNKPTDVGITLSACLIVKNEEKHLDRCLSSLKGLVDEIVVVDTGSTDRTIEIAEKHGAKIGHFKWCDDFAAARNESLKLATGHWALWIDADEELDKEGFNAIREGLIRPQFGGYFVKIVNYMDEKGDANQYVHSPVRIFRRIPGIEFTGRIHEQVLHAFKEMNLVPATLGKARLFHYGYQASTMNEKGKLQRTISMLEKEVEEFPKDPFHWFNLANAYSVGGQVEKAESAAKKSIEFLEAGAPYGPVAYQILASSLTAQGKYGQALEVCDKADRFKYGSVLSEFERAHAFKELQEYRQALSAIDRCLAMEWPDDLTGDYGIKTYKGQVLKAQILLGLSRYDEAKELIDGALKLDPNYPMGQFALALYHDQTGNDKQAYKLYLQCSDLPGLAACKKLAGRSASKLKKHPEAANIFEKFWKENTGDKEAWFGWITSAEAAGDLKSCLRGYDNLAAMGPMESDLLVNWGRILAKTGDSETAMKKYSEAVDADPNNFNAYFNCGDVLYSQGHFNEAAHVYSLGLEKNPQHAQAWFCLANAFAQAEKYENAVRSYKQCLKIDEMHQQAQHNLSLVERMVELAA